MAAKQSFPSLLDLILFVITWQKYNIHLDNSFRYCNFHIAVDKTSLTGCSKGDYEQTLFVKDILDHFDPTEELIEDWQLYIGQDASYYIKEWLKIRNGHVFTFNLSALIFNVFWMLYRKMYQPAILYLSFFFAEVQLCVIKCYQMLS